jgi:hypothetical protein
VTLVVLGCWWVGEREVGGGRKGRKGKGGERVCS